MPVQRFSQCCGFCCGDLQRRCGDQQCAAALQLQVYRVGAYPETGFCGLSVKQCGERGDRPVDLFFDFEGLTQPGFSINRRILLQDAAAAHAAQDRRGACGDAFGAGRRQQVGDEQCELHVRMRRTELLQ